MESPRSRVLNDFPYPVAFPYSLIFDEKEKPSIRRWALCFTEYQLLRMACLPLVSQYLDAEEVDQTQPKGVEAINRAIAAIRSPFFSDWITLLHTLRRHLPRVGIEPLFPHLNAALDTLKPEQQPIGLRGQTRLDPLLAILALRNGTAHGGLPDETEAKQHLDTYLPVLHQVLTAFDFLGDAVLKVCCDERALVATGRGSVQTLRGVALAEPTEDVISDDLADAFVESAAVLITLAGEPIPLYPLFNPVCEKEPLYLYDGHYGIQVGTKQVAEERSYIYYLGTYHRAADGPACEKLRSMLDKRKLSFFLEKEDTAPWSIADSAADYSRRTLDGLIHAKYFPECYLPFPDLERHFEAFLRVPEAKNWSEGINRCRYVNGFILIGPAGAGKTAFLARQVEGLLVQPEETQARENSNLVLFMRGDAIAVRPEGVSLFRDVADKLGIGVEGTSTPAKSHGGFSSFRELLEHLHRRWKQDRVEGRRLILVFDALNEAPYAEKVIREALEMVTATACFPWCKIIISTRQEWLSLWSGKMGAQESSPLEELRPFLYMTEQQGPTTGGSARIRGDEGSPVVTIEPFTEEQGGEVYGRYQAQAQQTKIAAAARRMPACETLWRDLSAETKGLLLNPLHLHLFMETFDRKAAEPVLTAPALFRKYVAVALQQRAGLKGSIEPVIDHLLKDLNRPSANLSDNDVSTIRRIWVEGRSPEEARLELSPVEGLAHEGWIKKRVRKEGGGYRFVFQAVAEYLIYFHLIKQRPQNEEEIVYWTHLASPTAVFPEYEGAFFFLMRDWAAEQKLAQAGPLIENSPTWFSEVLVACLIEQAMIGYVPGVGSKAAEVAAQAMSQLGTSQCAAATYRAAHLLMETRFAGAATVYFKATASIRETLWQANPDNVEIGNELGEALSSLGAFLSEAGNVIQAEVAYRRSVEIREILCRAHPDNVKTSDNLGRVLNEVGMFLHDVGKIDEAELACLRSVQIIEALSQANPKDLEISNGLGGALNNLGCLLGGVGKLAEAEAAYRRSVQIHEALWRANLDNVDIGLSLGGTLNNLGNFLSARNKSAEAETAYRRSVQIFEAMWQANPETRASSYGLGKSLSNLGQFLSEAGKMAEAEETYMRSVEIYETAWKANPDNTQLRGDLGSAANALGRFLSHAGKMAEAQVAYSYSAEIYEGAWQTNPGNMRIGDGIGIVAHDWGQLLRDVSKTEEAESAYRRSVQIYEVLWKANPGGMKIGNNLGVALDDLGQLLAELGKVAEAESAYRRSVEIREALWQANHDNLEIAVNLGWTLNSLALWLREVGKMEEAETACLRSVQIGEGLSQANRDDVRIAGLLAGALNHLGDILSVGGRVVESETAYLRSVQIIEPLWQANPNNFEIGDGLGKALRDLGLLLKDVGRVAEAEAAYQRAVQIYRALWEANPQKEEIGDGLGTALNDLGLLLLFVDKVADAEAAFRRSVQIREALWHANPESVEIAGRLAGVLFNLGLSLSAAGKEDEAEAALQRSVQIIEPLWQANHDNIEIGDGLGVSLNKLGDLLNEAGKLVDAEAAYQRSVQIYETLWQANPRTVDIGKNLGLSLDNLSLLLSVAGKETELQVAYQRSVQIYEALWDANPANLDIGKSLGIALHLLGISLFDVNRVDEAEAAYRRSVQIREGLLQANPDNVGIAACLGETLSNLGNLLGDVNKVDEAEAVYRRSVQINDALWQANQDNVEVGDSLGSTLNTLGNLLSDIGQVSDAERAYRRSVEVYETLSEANPENSEIGGLAGALNNLGNLLGDVDQMTGAEEAYRHSVQIREALWQANLDDAEIGDGLGRVLNNLGNLLSDAGKVLEAADAYRRSVEIFGSLCQANPDDLELKLRYAESLCSVRRFDEAEMLVDELLALDPAHPEGNKLKRSIKDAGLV